MIVARAPFEEKKSDIMRRAVELFARNGYEKTTMNDIANVCDMSKGNFYNYFRSKEDLVYMILDWVTEEFDDEVAKLDARLTKMGAEDTLKYYIRVYLQSVNRKQDAYIFLDHVVISLDREGARRILKRAADIWGTFERLMLAGEKEGIFIAANAKFIAHNIAYLGNAWAYNRWYLHKLMTLDEYIKEQTDFIMRSIKR